jgi:hypothetical protein
MKNARLIIGICTILLSFIVMFQSCAVGVAEAIIDNGGTSGGAGFMLTFIYIIAGIVGIVCRKNKTGSIVAGCFYLLGFIIGYTNTGLFADLIVWSYLSLIFAAVFIIGGVVQKDAVLED